MFKLTKNLPIQGCWIFRIQEGGFDKEGGGNSGGVETPVGAFCQYLTFSYHNKK